MSVLFVSYLADIGQSGEASAQFLAVYKRLINTGQWKYYLAIKGVLMKIGNLITKVSARAHTHMTTTTTTTKYSHDIPIF